MNSLSQKVPSIENATVIPPPNRLKFYFVLSFIENANIIPPSLHLNFILFCLFCMMMLKGSSGAQLNNIFDKLSCGFDDPLCLTFWCNIL
jgi:hypothetical protein